MHRLIRPAVVFVSVLLVAVVMVAARSPRADGSAMNITYLLEVEGKMVAPFQSFGNLGSRSEVIVETSVNPDTGEKYTSKTPGALEWLDFTLEQGQASSSTLQEWRQQVIDGKIADARTNCSLVAVGRGGTEVARWNFENAWPRELSLWSTSGDTKQWVFSKVVIVCEHCERVP